VERSPPTIPAAERHIGPQSATWRDVRDAVAGLERKNNSAIAEQAGEIVPAAGQWGR
jgi:hypothetical protein